MKRLVLASLMMSGLFVGSLSAFAQDVPGLNNVVWIWLENVSDAQMVQQTYTKSLLANYPSVHFTNFSPTSSVTQADVISMVSGYDQGITSNNTIKLLAPSLVDLVMSKNVSWKVYAEDFPGSCFLGDNIGNYYRYRNPFASIVAVESDRFRCMNLLGFSNYNADVKNSTLPQVAILIPGLASSGGSTNPATADAMLQTILKNILANSAIASNTTFIISTTSTKTPTAPVFTMIFGNGLTQKGQSVSTPYNHYNILRTIEDALGLGHLNQQDAVASPMVGFWN